MSTGRFNRLFRIEFHQVVFPLNYNQMVYELILTTGRKFFVRGPAEDF